MRIGIQGWGSEGDLRPLVALAAGLRARGHEVRVVLTPVDGSDHRPLCERAGVPLRIVPEGPLDFTLDRVATDAQSVDPLKISRELNERAFFPFLDALYASALELCEASDVVLWHYSAWYVRAAALKTQTPDGSVHFFPGLVPSRHVPPSGLPNLGPLNRSLWWMARTALDLQFRKRPAQFFSDHGLPPIRHVLPDLLFSDRLNLHAFSPLLVPPQRDWSPTQKVCGQFVVSHALESWKPSPALEAFLSEGERPVLMTLGSMEHFAPARARALLASAARKAGVRAIVQTKRSELESCDRDVFFLPWAPHEALLPRCSAMVHHGGAGTTHTALRAGVPSVPVPFIMEQKLWADRIHKLGCATKPVDFWKANADMLAKALQEVIGSPALKARAAEMGVRVSAEDGVRAAAELLETTHSPS